METGKLRLAIIAALVSFFAASLAFAADDESAMTAEGDEAATIEATAEDTATAEGTEEEAAAEEAEAAAE